MVLHIFVSCSSGLGGTAGYTATSSSLLILGGVFLERYLFLDAASQWGFRGLSLVILCLLQLLLQLVDLLLLTQYLLLLPITSLLQLLYPLLQVDHLQLQHVLLRLRLLLVLIILVDLLLVQVRYLILEFLDFALFFLGQFLRRVLLNFELL